MCGDHGGNAQSNAARQAVHVKALRARVLNAIIAKGKNGMTCDEAEVELDMSHQTCSARFTELKRDKYIAQAGKRPTRTGCQAAVYVAMMHV